MKCMAENLLYHGAIKKDCPGVRKRPGEQISIRGQKLTSLVFEKVGELGLTELR